MCFVRISTSKGTVFKEIKNTNYIDITVGDIMAVVYEEKDGADIFGWVEVDENNKLLNQSNYNDLTIEEDE